MKFTAKLLTVALLINLNSQATFEDIGIPTPPQNPSDVYASMKDAGNRVAKAFSQTAEGIVVNLGTVIKEVLPDTAPTASTAKRAVKTAAKPVAETASKAVEVVAETATEALAVVTTTPSRLERLKDATASVLRSAKNGIVGASNNSKKFVASHKKEVLITSGVVAVAIAAYALVKNYQAGEAALNAELDKEIDLS